MRGAIMKNATVASTKAQAVSSPRACGVVVVRSRQPSQIAVARIRPAESISAQVCIGTPSGLPTSFSQFQPSSAHRL
jgi:hypothetical protein